MDGASNQIDRILNLSRWQHVQDSLAEMTNLAIVTVNYKGDRMTRHSGCRTFCACMRADSVGGKRCRVCDSRSGLEAARTNLPYIGLCHSRIVDLAVPIVVDDTYVGALMAGQVRLDDETDVDTLEKTALLPPISCGEHEGHAMAQLYDELPVMSLEEVRRAADTLFALVGYVVAERMDMHRFAADVTLSRDGRVASLTEEGARQRQTPHKRREMPVTGASALARLEVEAYTARNPSLQPAFDHIFAFRGKMVTLRECADACHLNAGYFGRMFSRETGRSFARYTAELKVSWAKEMLVTTGLSISQISSGLGFGDVGYFIKQFKRCEHVTPGAYREARLQR